MIVKLIDIALVVIILVCAYRGFRNGFVRGICGFLAIILSLIIANAAASAFSDEFTDALRPFVGGIVDSKVQGILQPNPEADDAEKVEELIKEYGVDTTYGMSMATLRNLGFLQSVSEKLSEMLAEQTAQIGYALGERITDMLSSAIAHIAVFAAAFILLSIIFAVLGNLLNVVFSLPGLHLLDTLLGVAFGLLKGVVIVLFIALIFRYVGILGPGMIEETSVLEYFVKHNAIANALGI